MNTRNTIQMIAILLALGLTACIEAPDTKGNGNNNNNNNNNLSFVVTQFHMTNTGHSSVYVDDFLLQRVFDGETEIQLPEPCTCDELDCAAWAGPAIYELRPGETKIGLFDGRQKFNDGACEFVGFKGKTLEAELCYGINYEGADEFERTMLGRTCQRVEFVAGVDDIIPVAIAHEVQPNDKPFTVVLENLGTQPVFIQETQFCDFNAWVSLASSGEEVRGGHCLCECGEGLCDIACAAEACPQDSIRTLEPGETIEATFSNTYSRVYSSEEAGECVQHQYIPQPTSFEVCYGTDVVEEEVGSSFLAGEVICQSQVAEITSGGRLTFSAGGARL